jgi:predicted DsbA family dithiol-disulfide isomerase
MAIKFTSPGNPLENAGKGVGIDFTFNRWVFNSTDCHRVMEWCNEHHKELADGLMEKLFYACHVQGKDLANRENLMEAFVAAPGLESFAGDVRGMLESSDPKDAVGRKVREAKDLYRVSGVPFFIIDNQNGGRPSAFSGAQVFPNVHFLYDFWYDCCEHKLTMNSFHPVLLLFV